MSTSSNTDGRYFLDKDGNEFSYGSNEEKALWLKFGESAEQSFVEVFGDYLQVDLNPRKVLVDRDSKTSIDLVQRQDRNLLADLKAQNTPFFTCYAHNRPGLRYHPAETVTFNVKDAYRYQKYLNKGLLIYFWVHWDALVVIQREKGHEVWRSPRSSRLPRRSRVFRIAFDKLDELRKTREIHWYVQRKIKKGKDHERADLLRFEPRLEEEGILRDPWSDQEARRQHAACSYLLKFDDLEEAVPQGDYTRLTESWLQRRVQTMSGRHKVTLPPN